MFTRTVVAGAVALLLYTQYPPQPQPTKLEQAKKAHQDSLPARLLQDVKDGMTLLYRTSRFHYAADYPVWNWL